MLTRVARMYHEEGLPQREIASRLSLSQSRVSRMLRRSGGTQKYPAVRAALRGGWVNVLITDAASAHRLAEETV